MTRRIGAVCSWIFMFSMLATPRVAWTQPVQFGDGNFYEVVTDQLDWLTAREAATARTHMGIPGRLATITSQQENDFIVGAFSFLSAWIGGSDAAMEGTWQWTVGPEADTVFWIGDQNGQVPIGAFVNWSSGEPNDAGNEDYTELLGNGIWNDQSVSDQIGFVVEYEIPEPTTGAVFLLGALLAVVLARRRA